MVFGIKSKTQRLEMARDYVKLLRPYLDRIKERVSNRQDRILAEYMAEIFLVYLAQEKTKARLAKKYYGEVILEDCVYGREYCTNENDRAREIEKIESLFRSMKEHEDEERKGKRVVLLRLAVFLFGDFVGYEDPEEVREAVYSNTMEMLRDLKVVRYRFYSLPHTPLNNVAEVLPLESYYPKGHRFMTFELDSMLIYTYEVLASMEYKEAVYICCKHIESQDYLRFFEVKGPKTICSVTKDATLAEVYSLFRKEYPQFFQGV